MAEKKETPEVQEAETKEVAQEQPGLTVNDLAMMVQVIQLATQRGTFKADELSAVGGLYDRVSKFLAAVAPPPADAKKE